MVMFDLKDCEDVVLIDNKCPEGVELLKTVNCKNVVVRDQKEDEDNAKD